MKKFILLTGLVFGAMQALAQQEYSFTNYFEVNSFYNPAATGASDVHGVTGLFRRQWVGFEGTPLTGGVVYDTRLDKYRMGLGGYVFTDRVGATFMTNVAVNYSYSLKLNDDLQLAFGLDGGVDIYSTDYDRLVYWQDDQMFDNQRAVHTVPRAGVGTHFYGENFYVGISVPRLLNFNNTSALSISADNLPSVVSNYYVTAGYTFDAGDQFKIQTNLLGKYTKNVIPQGDINVMCTYQDMIGLGVGYKSLGFATTYIQYQYEDVVKIGYAFDFSLTEMARYSTGTHEIMIQYILPKKQNKAKSSMQ